MENNKSYRIRTDIGGDKNINLQVNQDYDILEILSLKISTDNIYKFHSSSYGCIVGRVLANGGVGIPNAKISIFIEVNEDTKEDDILYYLYPYSTTATKNSDGIRYNLLPDEQVTLCHQQIGTFPNKRLVLDDKNTLEIFDTYYKYTTISNNAGDYMLFGVPTGNQNIHIDIDLSDIGFLSQKPIDMVYKGYSIGQFENAQQFKKDTNISALSQVITQNSNVFVNSFWGDEDEGEVSITRHDIDIDYKFEPSCIFMGSLVTDNESNGFSKKCIPTPNMGTMENLITGSGTIEMIRKKMDGTVEEFAIQGTQLIDGNGTWCYQIPMNLDYVTTDEYGNLVPSDNPEKGIATRTRVRFRMSLSNFDNDYSNNHLVKVLVPNNPNIGEEPDYVFGTYTRDNLEGTQSFRDLMWNNVYTVKSFIPRIQKGNYQRTKKFSGIKAVNVHGQNSPIPYNNIRVNITFMFILQCATVKALFRFARFYNRLLCILSWLGSGSSGTLASNDGGKSRCVSFGDSLCPDAENWYYSPGCSNNCGANFINRTLDYLNEDNTEIDNESTGASNSEEMNGGDLQVCLTTEGTYFIQCVELNLAMENNVIQFDFYNDWINGLLYIPRWFVQIRKKASFFFGLIRIKPKIKACMEDSFYQTRRYTQQCALDYQLTKGETNVFSTNASAKGCKNDRKQKCHKTKGRKQIKIFGGRGGLIHNEENLKGLRVYYAKPMENYGDGKCNLFATDIVMLGSISNENIWGIPNEFDGMVSSSYQMPPNLVQTNMDTDGVVYGMSSSGYSYCSKERGRNKLNSLKQIPQTFEDYKKWTETEEFKADDDVDEYAVTEIAGIDWGLRGPNQGKNNLGKLYFPGGHFLGISCTNAEVNIKSCINLSRICEIGSTMSQRQSEVVNKGNNFYDYDYIIPSGLISKLELSDTNYRTIFATLNHNRLKTIVNPNGTRKYDFISVNPINYGGELTNETQNDAYINVKDDNELGGIFNAVAYTKTIEDNSRDYYYFRLGINSKNPQDVSVKEIKKRYLIKSSQKVALPVYENSYYFYFGLKDGSTAMNKFMSDYYAECPNPNDKIEPEVKEINVRDIVICGNKGGLDIYLDNAEMLIPYRVVLVSPSDRLKELSRNNINTHSFHINEKDKDNILTEVGTYEIMFKNDNEGLSLSKKFYINAVLPTGSTEYNFHDESYKTTANDFFLENDVTFDKNNNIEIKGAFDDFITSGDGSTADNGGYIFVEVPKYDETLKGPYVIGLIVTGEGYSAYYDLCGTKNNNTKSIIEKYVEKNENDRNNILINNASEVLFKDLGNDKKANLTISVWGTGNYKIKVLYSCEKVGELTEESLNIYEIGEETIGVKMLPYSMYVYDQNLRLDKLSNAGIITIIPDERKSLVNDIYNANGEKITDDFKGSKLFKRGYISRINKTIPRFIVDKDSSDGEKLKLSDVEKWKLKKTFIFDKSKYSNEKSSCIVGTINGNSPLKNLTHGNAVKYNSETGKYSIKTFKSIEDAQKEGYNFDFEEILLPSEGWLDLDNEFKDVITGSKTTECLLTVAAEEDAEGYRPVFGKMKPSDYIENGFILIKE